MTNLEDLPDRIEACLDYAWNSPSSFIRKQYSHLVEKYSKEYAEKTGFYYTRPLQKTTIGERK